MTENEAGSGGVDYAWVMQTTFVATILVGVPVVVLLSLLLELSTWGQRVEFTVRVGALVWLITAVSLYVYARRNDVGGTAEEEVEAKERTSSLGANEE